MAANFSYDPIVGSMKRGILLFWSVWTGIVALMNTGDALKVEKMLPEDWKLASGNYAAIVDVTSTYNTPRGLDFLLLLGATCWESLCSILFFRAFRQFGRGAPQRWGGAHRAFGTLLGLFASFILADEIFHAFKMERDHRGIALLALTSLMSLHVLPEPVHRKETSGSQLKRSRG